MIHRITSVLEGWASCEIDIFDSDSITSVIPTFSINLKSEYVVGIHPIISWLNYGRDREKCRSCLVDFEGLDSCVPNFELWLQGLYGSDSQNLHQNFHLNIYQALPDTPSKIRPTPKPLTNLVSLDQILIYLGIKMRKQILIFYGIHLNHYWERISE